MRVEWGVVNVRGVCVRVRWVITNWLGIFAYFCLLFYGKFGEGSDGFYLGVGGSVQLGMVLGKVCSNMGGF